MQMIDRKIRFFYLVETGLIYTSSFLLLSVLLTLFSKSEFFEFSNNIFPLWRLNSYLTLPYLISISIGMMVAPLLWERVVRKISFQQIGFIIPGRLGKEIFYGFVFFLVFLLFIYFAFLHKRQIELPPGNMAIYWIVGWFVVAFAEEILYRGIIQRRLSVLFGKLSGVIIASMIFAILGHTKTPIFDNLILRLPFGLMLGYLYVRSNSLLIPISLHWGFNLLLGYA